MALSPRLKAHVVLGTRADDVLVVATAAIEAGDTESAIQIARRAAALTPEAPWPYRLLATLSADGAAVAGERRLGILEPGDEASVWRAARRLAAIAHAGVSHAGISHAGISHAGISHAGISHVGISHAGISHAGISHVGADTGCRALDRRLAHHPADAWDLYTRALTGLLGEDAVPDRGNLDIHARNLVRATRLRPEWRTGAWSLGGALVLEGRVGAAARLFAALGRAGPPPGGLDQAARWPTAIVAALKDGASLASVMVPDPRLPSNAPEYLESYRFEQLVVSPRCFWALPPPIDFEPPTGRFSAFAYCGDSRLFLRYTTGEGSRPGSPVDLLYYPGNAYKRFAFVVDHDHRLVYDSRAPAETSRLEEALAAGGRLRLVMEADDGLVQVLPVHLCFLYRDSGAVRVVSEGCHAPEICLWPVEALWPFWSGLLDGFAARTDFKEMLQPGRTRLIFRRLTIYAPDNVESFADDGRLERISCRWFRLYARPTV